MKKTNAVFAMVSILHKCDYNAHRGGGSVLLLSVSILHKCDYNHSCQRARSVLCAFQFYISAIITLVRTRTPVPI